MNFSLLLFETAVAPALNAAGESSAHAGGDGVAFAIGGTALGAIVTALVNIWRSRNQKTEIAPDPLNCKKDEEQAKWEGNEKEHGEIFGRLNKLEADVAGHTQAIFAMRDMQNRIYDMVTKLYDRICCGNNRSKHA